MIYLFNTLYLLSIYGIMSPNSNEKFSIPNLHNKCIYVEYVDFILLMKEKCTITYTNISICVTLLITIMNND